MKIIYPQTDESQVRSLFQRRIFNWKKRIVKVETNYLPCYLFQVKFKSKRGDKTFEVICDALKGKVRRISWPQPLSSSGLNSQKAVLDEAAALEKIKEEVRWFSFPFGLKIQKKYSLESVIPLGKVGYPFWVVYYKKNNCYNFFIYDGLTGKKEDFFAKDIFLELFGLRLKEEGDA